MRSVALVVLALLIGLNVAAQEVAPQSEPDNIRSSAAAKGEPVMGFEVPPRHEFSALGYKFTISSNGRGIGERAGSPVRPLNLRVHKNDKLDGAVYFAEYENDLLLTCVVSDGLYGSGFITRLDGRTLAMKWKRSIPAFNVGRSLIEDDHAYVTAIGFVGKVNLKSGVFAWKHDDLYTSARSYGDSNFNSFELPKVEGDIVLFTEVEVYKKYPPTTLKVHKRTGRIVSIGN